MGEVPPMRGWPRHFSAIRLATSHAVSENGSGLQRNKRSSGGFEVSCGYVTRTDFAAKPSPSTPPSPQNRPGHPRRSRSVRGTRGCMPVCSTFKTLLCPWRTEYGPTMWTRCRCPRLDLQTRNPRQDFCDEPFERWGQWRSSVHVVKQVTKNVVRLIRSDFDQSLNGRLLKPVVADSDSPFELTNQARITWCYFKECSGGKRVDLRKTVDYM